MVDKNSAAPVVDMGDLEAVGTQMTRVWIPDRLAAAQTDRRRDPLQGLLTRGADQGSRRMHRSVTDRAPARIDELPRCVCRLLQIPPGAIARLQGTVQTNVRFTIAAVY